MSLSAHLAQAMQLHVGGQVAQALSLYQFLLQTEPEARQLPQLWWGLALLAWQAGEGRRAEGFFQQAWQYAAPSLPLPNASEFGAFPRDYQQLVLSFVLALIAAWQASPARALAHQLAQRLCSYPPTHAEQSCILASLLHALGEHAQALQTCRQSLEISPSAQAWFVLAQLRFSLGDASGGSEACRLALDLDPLHSEARTLLAHALLESHQLEAALDQYETVLAQKPDFAALHFHLGRMYQSLGALPEAQRHYHRATEQAPNLLWELQSRLCYAPLPASQAALQKSLAGLESSLNQPQVAIELAPLQAQLAQTNLDTLFDLNYLCEDPLPLKRRFGQLFEYEAGPAAHSKPAFTPTEPARPLKMGVLISPKHEGVFAFVSGQLLAQLDPTDIEVTLLIWPASEAICAQLLPSLPRQILSADWAQSVASVQAKRFDLVYFWEVGTDPLNYFLPYFRLGKIQWTSWGSGGSTGHPQIDAFLSTQNLEGPQPESRYSEKLYQMQALPLWYEPRHLPASNLSRSQLGLPEDAVLALCPHNLLKLHPHFDAILAEICRQNPELKLVLVHSRNPVWNRQIDTRLKQNIAPEQLIFLQRLPAPDFLALLQVGDFALDPWPYGAGKLAFEMLGLGLPLLTRPSKMLKGRIPTALYQVLEMPELLARSEQDYLDKAHRLARDRSYREALKATLQERRSRLFANQAAVVELTQVLKQMAQ